MHDQEAERAILSSEGSLPLVTGSDADKVVSATEVDLGEDMRLAEAVQKVWNEQEWVSVFPCNHIQAAPIYAEVQGPIFFLDK